MTPGKTRKVKDALVNRLITLNDKLNSLSPAFLHSQGDRAEVQLLRETLHVEIKRHKAKGHDGKPCPAVKHLSYSPKTA